ncbi:hypothetical protein CAL65_12085, partial [Alkalilimnicola ehrlichii]
DGMTVRSHNGNVTIQAARNIRLTGRGGGDITVAQSGAGFSVKKDGTVRLFGNTVTLKADQGVTFNGPICYETGCDNAPEQVNVSANRTTTPIPQLVSEADEGMLVQESIADVTWSLTEAPLDQVIDFTFRTRALGGNRSAEIAILECSSGGQRRRVAHWQLPLNADTTLHTGSWQPEGSDLGQVDEQSLNGPLDYQIEVRLEDAAPATSRTPLRLLQNLIVNARSSDNQTLPDGSRLQLRDAYGRLRDATVRRGKVGFAAVPLGVMELSAPFIGNGSSTTVNSDDTSSDEVAVESLGNACRIPLLCRNGRDRRVGFTYQADTNLEIEMPAIGQPFFAVSTIEDQNEWTLTGIPDSYHGFEGYRRNVLWDQFLGFGGTAPGELQGTKSGTFLNNDYNDQYEVIPDRAVPPQCQFANFTASGILKDPSIDRLDVRLLNEQGQPLSFAGDIEETIKTVTAQLNGQRWTVTLPPLANPYFGIATLEIKAFYGGEPLAHSSSVLQRDILLLGVQAGWAEGTQPRTHADERIVTDFTDLDFIRDDAGDDSAATEAASRFRTRRMQTFTIDNVERPLPAYIDGEWSTEQSLAPRMPEAYAELQILGLGSDRAVSLYEAYAEELDASGDRQMVSCRWSGALRFGGGALRTPTDSFAPTRSDIESINGKAEVALSEFRSATQYYHTPALPPEAEIQQRKPSFEKRSWHNSSNEALEFDSFVLPWHPALGTWKNQQNNIIEGNEAGADEHYYQYKVRGGDIQLTANTQVLGSSFELSLPIARIEGKNPTVGDVRQILDRNFLHETLAPYQSGTPSIIDDELSTREKIEKIIETFGFEEFIELFIKLLWHESESQLPGSRKISNNKEIYHFMRQRSRYRRYNGVYNLRIQNWPQFGPPGGWGVAQLDNPPPTQNQIWNWKENVTGAFQLLVKKLSEALDRNFVFEGSNTQTVYNTNEDYKKSSNSM